MKSRYSNPINRAIAYYRVFFNGIYLIIQKGSQWLFASYAVWISVGAILQQSPCGEAKLLDAIMNIEFFYMRKNIKFNT